MAKKKNNYYFDNFTECINVSLEAAEKVDEILRDFHPDKLGEDIKQIHLIENKGDEKKHEMIAELMKAFITPIERDDIIQISHMIDNVTDSLENIIIYLYTWNVNELREGTLEISKHVIKCIKAVQELLEELPEYKKSNKLMDMIININHLEGEGDQLYISNLRKLSLECHDPLTVMAWKEIYHAFENVCDACESVGEIAEEIIIANS